MLPGGGGRLGGSVSPTVFPAAGLVGLGGREPVDQHVTRMVVDSWTAALNSVMKAVAWLGSWVAIVVAAVIVAVLVWTRRLPVLALDVAVLVRAGETGGVQIGKTCPGPRAAPASHPPGSGSRLLVSFQPCRGGVPGVHGLGLMPGCAG